MAALTKKFSIGKTRLERGLLQGFKLSDAGELTSSEGDGCHSLFLGHLDGSERDCAWGRFAFNCAMDKDAVLIVRAFASNDLHFIRNGDVTAIDTFLTDADEPVQHKEKLFAAMGALKLTDTSDVLLYGQSGRYLWISLEVFGTGCVSLTNLRVFASGDNFLNTFPEIYRRDGEFFHRYLSIFSTLYSDFQTTIDTLDSYVDIDTAPDRMLPVFAEWLGIELGGNFLDSLLLRRLIKSAYPLIRKKGTKQAISGIIRLFVDEEFFIVEQLVQQKYGIGADREVGKALYGRSPYEFTLLINRPADEKLHSRILFLINQFKPARSHVNIVFLSDNGSLDTYSYLDINARIIQMSNGCLDGQAALNGRICLQ